MRTKLRSEQRLPAGPARSRSRPSTPRLKPGGPLNITLSVDGDAARRGHGADQRTAAVHRQRLPGHRRLPRRPASHWTTTTARRSRSTARSTTSTCATRPKFGPAARFAGRPRHTSNPAAATRRHAPRYAHQQTHRLGPEVPDTGRPDSTGFAPVIAGSVGIEILAVSQNCALHGSLRSDPRASIPRNSCSRPFVDTPCSTTIERYEFVESRIFRRTSKFGRCARRRICGGPVQRVGRRGMRRGTRSG